MVELIANVNNAINGFVWGVPMLVLILQGYLDRRNNEKKKETE